jgi:hypothetical protein
MNILQEFGAGVREVPPVPEHLIGKEGALYARKERFDCKGDEDGSFERLRATGAGGEDGVIPLPI